MLYLHDTAASAVGVLVERRPARPVPRRKTMRFDVPGRTSALIRELDAFENVTLSYDIAILPLAGQTLAATVDLAVAWLLQKGPVRLYDTRDPDVFYLVTVPGGEQLADVLHRARRATVAFDADPRRYLLSGDTAVSLSGGGSKTLVNPTQNNAKPLVTVSGSGSGSLSTGGRSVSFSLSGGSRVIDLDTCSADGVISVPNNLWPYLAPGSNTVTLTGSGLTAQIKPRWYVL